MGKQLTKSADKRKPKHGLDASRPSASKKGQRDAATVRRLKMYSSTAKRDKKGKIVHQDLQSKELPSTRIQPDRRWFGNTRVIGQQQLDRFRDEMGTKVRDPYTVLIKEKKLPMSLLEDPEKKQQAAGKAKKAHLLQTQPFKETFGQKGQRKRPRLSAESYSELLNMAEKTSDEYSEAKEAAKAQQPEVWDGEKSAGRLGVFEKGQSRRIWGELYKVVDSSDVVIQVLDARDPQGTRCLHLERHLRTEARHKHLLFLLNKCDLVPAWVTKRWLATLGKEYPTLAFHASITNPFGKGSLLGVLRQLGRLHSDRKFVSVGFVGYPNVGKSSVINTLRTKKVCKVAPVPGETKVWQYITLTKRIFLIDCPGVVSDRAGNTDTDAVLKGIARIDKLDDATEHVAAVLARIKPEYLTRAYKVRSWEDATDFLAQVAKAAGKLVKGGEPDLNTVARMVLLDWQRGRLPYFSLPPLPSASEEAQQPVPVLPEASSAAVQEASAAAEDAAEDDQEAGQASDDGPPEEASAAALHQELPVRPELFLPGLAEDEAGAGALATEVAGTADAALQPGADGSDDDSDGYGSDGLSWEKVMASLQGPQQGALQ